MAKVRMRKHITGFRDGREWPAIGELLDCTDREAAHLVQAGYAEIVEFHPPPAEPAGDLPPPGDELGDPPDGKVEAVLEWVAGRPEAARVALDHEQAKAKPRKGLVAQLTEIAEQGDDADASTTGDTGGPDDDPPGSDGPPSDPVGPDAAGEPGGDAGSGDASSSREW
jgi:hypothetical protein